MLKLGRKIQNIKGKSKGNDEFVKTCVRVMQEMKWTTQELIDTPIPSFMIIVDVLNKDAQEQERKMKNKSKGRR